MTPTASASDAPSERATLALGFAGDSSKQVITLCVTFLAFTVTFRSEVVDDTAQSDEWWLWAAWVALGVSIAGGVWAMLAITGSLADKNQPISIYGDNVKWPAIVQMSAFGAGLVLFAAFGVFALTGTAEPAPAGECRIVAPASGTCTVDS